jgi:hypothetical protein
MSWNNEAMLQNYCEMMSNTQRESQETGRDGLIPVKSYFQSANWRLLMSFWEALSELDLHFCLLALDHIFMGKFLSGWQDMGSNGKSIPDQFVILDLSTEGTSRDLLGSDQSSKIYLNWITI